MLRNAFYILFTLAIALSTGFGSAYYMVENGRQLTASKYGAWYGWPDSGGADTHPYRRAALARSGALQLGRAEGVVFTATKDDEGEELTSNCQYRIFGSTPDASAWTLRAVPVGDRSSADIEHYLVSDQINRIEGGNFEVKVSPKFQPGNWLPTPAAQAFALKLSFYDTTAFLVLGNDEVRLPAIERGNCS